MMSFTAVDLSLVSIVNSFPFSSFSGLFHSLCITETFYAAVLLRSQQPNVTLVVLHHGGLG